MKMKLLAALLLGASASPALAQAWSPGSRVLVYHNADGYWYPATVARVTGNLVTATYLSNNSRISVPSNLVARLNWVRGTRMSCKYSDGDWYGATISGGPYQGNVVDVVYDDGERHRTNLRFCRTGRGLEE